MFLQAHSVCILFSCSIQFFFVFFKRTSVMHYLAVVEVKQGGMFLQVHTRESQALWTGVQQGWRAFLSSIERF